MRSNIRVAPGIPDIKPSCSAASLRNCANSPCSQKIPALEFRRLNRHLRGDQDGVGVRFRDLLGDALAIAYVAIDGSAMAVEEDDDDPGALDVETLRHVHEDTLVAEGFVLPENAAA